MTDANNFHLIGRLCRDVGSNERDFGYLPNGTAKANVSIAVNRAKKNGDNWVDETSFFDISVFGKQAENLKPYLKKGNQIYVEGYLKQDRWEKDGQKFSKVSMIAENIQLLGGKKEGNNSVQNNNSVPKFQPVNEEDNGSGFPEDIPF